MRIGGRLGAGIRRALGSGPGAGALVLSLLFFLDLLGASVEFMGFSGDAHAYDVILHRYGWRIARGQMEILATYAVTGALFGGAGALIGRLWDRGRSPGGWRRAARGAGAALGAHAYLLARSIDHYPQLYSEALYDRGGARRALQVTITRIPLSLLDAFFFIVVAALVAWPIMQPAAYSALAERARRAWSWTRASRRRAMALAALPIVLFVAGAAGFHRRAPARTTQRPNVLLLAVDSLRADRVFANDEAQRFPALAELAARGVRFREAHVTVPRTFPSFVTLLTGRWPHHHGIRQMFPPAAQRRAIGPALPAALAEAGYRTVAISDYAGEIFSRTPLGFTETQVPYFDMKTIISQRGLQVHPNVLPYVTTAVGRALFPAVEALPEHADPEILASRAIAQLDKSGDQPFFMTVFFSTAHFPYAAPAPWYQRFGAAGYDGAFRYQKPPLSTAKVGPDDAAQIRALYDGAVAATDHAIARLLRRLEEDGLSEQTIVVLLADHGENLYDVEGRGMGHGDHLRGSSADHVPLVVIDPVHHLAPHDVSGIVRDVDVSLTLGALTGVKAPPSDGVDLSPLLHGERASLDLHAFSETEFWFTGNGPGFMPDERLPYPGVTGVTDLADDDDVFLKPEWQDTVVVAKHRAVRTPEWKLLYRPTRGGALWTLYDLLHDPEERTDVAAAHPDVVSRLRSELIDWMTSDGKTVMRGGFAVPR
jgi:arylsulfatase A-like enzyme